MNSLLTSRYFRCVVLLGLTLPAGMARGVTNWTNPGLGDWFTGNYWSAGVPSAVVDARIPQGTVYLSSPGAVAKTLWLSGAASLIISKGGELERIDGSIIGAGDASDSLVVVHGAGSAWASGSVDVGGIFNAVLGNGNGTLRVESGGRVVSDDVRLGVHRTSHGSATVTGAGSRWNYGFEMVVGAVGTGSLTISDGGVVESVGDGHIGHLTGSSGSVSVTGANSRWDVGSTLRVGSAHGHDGVGTLQISSGGLVQTGHFQIFDTGSAQVNNGSSTVSGLTVSGGGFYSPQPSAPFGPLTIGGTAAGRMVVQGGTIWSGLGTIAANSGTAGSVLVEGANSRWTNIGDLSVGLFGGGELSVTGGGRVSNHSANIGSGGGSNGSVTVDGSGSVWENYSVLAVGSAGAGALSITGGGAVSSTIGRIARNAGSSGTVLIDGPGSRWTISDVFTMGLFNTGPATLTVQNGGVLSAAGGTSINSLGTIRGDGTIIGGVSHYGGTIAPGAATPGTLHITGNHNLTYAKLEIDLASNSSFDKLAVTGDMIFGGFGGNTLEVSLAGGYVPHGNQSFDVLDWGTLSGSFDSISLPTLGGTLVWNTSQLYTTGVLSVTGPPATLLAGDFDENGAVNSADLARWRTGFGTGTTHMQGNADADGDVDGGDFLVWQRQLGGSAAVSSATTASRPVPEPTSAGLLLAAACLLWSTKRGYCQNT